MTTDKSGALHYSEHVGPAGSQSPRCYTDEELAAAKRQGMARPENKVSPHLSGPLFWAAGPWWERELKRRARKAQRTIRDTEVLLAAMGREWGKEWS